MQLSSSIKLQLAKKIKRLDKISPETDSEHINSEQSETLEKIHDTEDADFEQKHTFQEGLPEYSNQYEHDYSEEIHTYDNNKSVSTSLQEYYEKYGDDGTSGWVECYDNASGSVYWYHTVTGESSWHNPHQRKEPEEGNDCTYAASDQAAWEECFDEESGLPYWYNTATGESSWENPYN
mmetsp:Transcript_13839/g.15774  ORF Transcript_13839/g.15774 Transcript_13839/m.15774 type:complete len:179 (+) Transcript_13839:2-538(+)